MTPVPDLCHVNLAAYGHILRMVEAFPRSPARSFWHGAQAFRFLVADNPGFDTKPPSPDCINLAPYIVAEALHHSDPRWVPGWDPGDLFDPATLAWARSLILGFDITCPEDVFAWNGFHCALSNRNSLGFGAGEIAEWYLKEAWVEAVEATEFPDPGNPGRTLSGRVTSTKVIQLPSHIDPGVRDNDPTQVPLIEVDCGTTHLNLMVGPESITLFTDPDSGEKPLLLACAYTGYPGAADLRTAPPLDAVCAHCVRASCTVWNFDAPDRPDPQGG